MSFSNPEASVYGHFKPESGKEKQKGVKLQKKGCPKYCYLSLFGMLFVVGYQRRFQN
jgi:hypothetical protein